jgi:hypothetical protein
MISLNLRGFIFYGIDLRCSHFFQEFECMVERMFNRKIVAVQSD